MAFPTPLLPIQVADNHSFAIAPTNNINNYKITANTARTITFPVDAYGAKPKYAIMKAAGGGDFWARWDGNAAAIPIADSSDGLGSEVNPSNRIIQNLTAFSVIAAADTYLGIAYYF